MSCELRLGERGRKKEREEREREGEEGGGGELSRVTIRVTCAAVCKVK